MKMVILFVIYEKFMKKEHWTVYEKLKNKNKVKKDKAAADKVRTLYRVIIVSMMEIYNAWH